MNSSATPFLVADIGGTNARFALFKGDPGGFASLSVLACDDYPSLTDAIRDYLTRTGNPAVQEAVIAIATPILGDTVRMTNHHWSFSIEQTRRDVRLNTLLVINDFSALAMSLPYLKDSQLRRLDHHREDRAGVKAVLGPGTGLGVAGLVPTDSGWQAIATEGGHASFSPIDALELELLTLLWREHAHVSAERVISGPGIALLYRALCTIAGTLPAADNAAQIVELAASGACKTAQQTMYVFSGMLGALAGNVALTLGATGGVYLGGGVLGKLGATFDVDVFCRRFIDKGRFENYLDAIPRYLIVEEQPALIGAAQALRRERAIAGKNA